jgi:hypothetical protein
MTPRIHPSPFVASMLVALACGSDTPAMQETGSGVPTTDDNPSSSGAETGSSGSATATDATSGAMTTMPPTSTDPDPDSSSDDGPKFDVSGTLDKGSSGCIGHDTNATLTGTVYGPDGELPVSGALVYVTPDEPAGIPQQVYCAACTELGCDDDQTLTNADGTFSLPAASGQDKYLVVQKGQFMRVTPLDIGPGPAAINDAYTTLPGQNDPDNGEYIPLIAVGDGSYDRLEDALGKFGMGDTVVMNFEERLVPGTETFDLWDNGQDPGFDGFASQGTFAELVSNPDALDDYHIIFVPCSTDDFTNALSVPQNVQNIREWVAAGGRWYVSDWSNEWLQLVFPEYQDLASWDGSVGSADNGSYDSLANVNDDDLLAWLEALPEQFTDINPQNDEPHPALDQLPQVMTVDNWSGITQTLPVMVDDGMGGMVDVGHKVWLEGPGGDPAAIHPLTVTGQFGCGKIQFTSYHTAEFFNYVGLSPQELVLIYTILEIGACQEPLPPPEG